MGFAHSAKPVTAFHASRVQLAGPENNSGLGRTPMVILATTLDKTWVMEVLKNMFRFT